MKEIDLTQFDFHKKVCDWCYPAYHKELYELVKHLLPKKEDVFVKEHLEEYEKITEEFTKGKRVNCLVLDYDSGIWICKKHLTELAEKMPS